MPPGSGGEAAAGARGLDGVKEWSAASSLTENHEADGGGATIDSDDWILSVTRPGEEDEG